MKRIYGVSLGLSLAVSVQAQTGAFTDTFSNYHLNDGGSFNGTITISFVSGTPTAVDSFDIVTGAGSAGTGASYIYNLPGANVASVLLDRVSSAGGDNEINYQNSAGDSMFFDYVMNAGQLQLFIPSNDDRNVTSENGSDLRELYGSQPNGVQITTVPEPTTLVLAGLGAAGLLIFRRRK
jgi:hypothetical protein